MSGAFSVQAGQFYDGTITAFSYTTNGLSPARISILKQFSVEPRDALAVELARVAAMPGFSVRHTQLYRGYAVYAVITKS